MVYAVSHIWNKFSDIFVNIISLTTQYSVKNRRDLQNCILVLFTNKRISHFLYRYCHTQFVSVCFFAWSIINALCEYMGSANIGN